MGNLEFKECLNLNDTIGQNIAIAYQYLGEEKYIVTSLIGATGYAIYTSDGIIPFDGDGCNISVIMNMKKQLLYMGGIFPSYDGKSTDDIIAMTNDKLYEAIDNYRSIGTK